MARRRTARDYEDDVTAASRAGLAELMTALGAYRAALVLIGGWAPHLILETFGEPAAFQEDASQADAFQTKFVHVAIPSARSGRTHLIRVDFLSPKPLPGGGRTHRHREVQRDLRARTLEGAEVALAHHFWYELAAQVPGGASANVRLKVADIVGSLVLKGLAIGDRYAEKDAYDIYALCAHYRGGPPTVADALRPFREGGPVRRGLTAIAEKFRAPDAEGPTWSPPSSARTRARHASALASTPS